MEGDGVEFRESGEFTVEFISELAILAFDALNCVLGFGVGKETECGSDENGVEFLDCGEVVIEFKFMIELVLLVFEVDVEANNRSVSAMSADSDDVSTEGDDAISMMIRLYNSKTELTYML